MKEWVNLKAQECLEGHMLYQLDKLIEEHLGWYLREEIGDPFRIYCATFEAQELRFAKENNLRWRRALATQRQDDGPAKNMVEPSIALAIEVNREKNLAWSILLKKAKGDLRELCALYSAIASERHALERAADAIEWADTYCSKAYAVQVRAALDLEHQLTPWWWRLNLSNTRKHFVPKMSEGQ